MEIYIKKLDVNKLYYELLQHTDFQAGIDSISNTFMERLHELEEIEVDDDKKVFVSY